MITYKKYDAVGIVLVGFALIATASQEPSYPPCPGIQQNAEVAFDGVNFFIVWADKRNNTDFDIYGARVTPAGRVLDPGGIPISTASGDQHTMKVTFDGVNYMVVWQDYRNPAPGWDWAVDIYGARVDTSGTVLDPEGIPISTAENGQYHPKVIFDGANYFIIWSDRRNYDGSEGEEPADTYGTRMTLSGTVLDPDGIAINIAQGPPGNGHEPDVAFDGIHYLVVWQDRRSEAVGEHGDVYGQLLNTDGSPYGNDFPICTETQTSFHPRVIFDGTRFLVAWSDTRRNYGTEYDLYAQFVNASGGLEGSEILVSAQAEDQTLRAVVYNEIDDVYLFLWDCTIDETAYDVYVKFMNESGVLFGEKEITEEAGVMAWDPGVVFSGTDFFVVWKDDRNGTDYEYDIYASRLTSSGDILDKDGLLISTGSSQVFDYLPSITFVSGQEDFPKLSWSGESGLCYGVSCSSNLVDWISEPMTRNGIRGTMTLSIDELLGSILPAKAFFRLNAVYQQNEDGEFEDILTPGYYNAPADDVFRDELNRFVRFVRREVFHHPLQDQQGQIPAYSVPIIGRFGAGKGPTGTEQHHPATDLRLDGQLTEVNLFAAHSGTVATFRDADKYRHYLSITKQVVADSGERLGKIVTIYGHIDLDLDEADGIFLNGTYIEQGDLVSAHLYSETVGGPHLHFEIRYYRAADLGTETFYSFAGEDLTEPGAGSWPYGVWNPDVGYGFGRPDNHGVVLEVN